MSAYMATLLDARSIIVSKVVTGDMSVEDGIAQYEKEQGALSDSIVAELNSK
jgi:predicted nucleic-acid-binding protein